MSEHRRRNRSPSLREQAQSPSEDEPFTSASHMPSRGRGKAHHRDTVPVERVQTGVRLERRVLKVLKALAEYLDISLGDLIEGIVLHTFEGRLPFDQETMHAIIDLKKVYGLTLTSEDSHILVDAKEDST